MGLETSPGNLSWGRGKGPVSGWPLSLTALFLPFSIRDLLKFKEEVTKERDQLLSEVVKLRESLAQTTEQHQEMERAKEEAQQTISQVGLPCSPE